MSRIYLRLEEICRGSDAIQLHRNSIAMFFLWATRTEIIDGSRLFELQSDITRRRLLELWDRIHLVNPVPAATYLDVLLSYVDVDQGRVTVCRGSEQGARAASLCLLRALSGINPTSTTLEDIRQRYVAVIPPNADFGVLLCYHEINAIHATLVSSLLRRFFEWTDHEPRVQEHAFFAKALVQAVYNGRHHEKAPRWVLRFVVCSLSRDPPSSVSVVTDCLTIIAIDLGCDIQEGDVRNPNEKYARLSQLHSLSC